MLAVVAVDSDGRHGLGHGDHRHVDRPGHPLGRAVAGPGLGGGDGGLGHQVHVRPGDPRGVGGEDDGAVHLGQLRQALGRVLRIEQEPTRAHPETPGSSPTRITRRAPPAESGRGPPELGARRNHRQRSFRGSLPPAPSATPASYPAAPRAPASDWSRLSASARVRPPAPPIRPAPPQVQRPWRRAPRPG